MDIDSCDVEQVSDIIEFHIECFWDSIVVELELFVFDYFALVKILEFVLLDVSGGGSNVEVLLVGGYLEFSGECGCCCELGEEKNIVMVVYINNN